TVLRRHFLIAVLVLLRLLAFLARVVLVLLLLVLLILALLVLVVLLLLVLLVVLPLPVLLVVFLILLVLFLILLLLLGIFLQVANRFLVIDLGVQIGWVQLERVAIRLGRHLQLFQLVECIAEVVQTPLPHGGIHAVRTTTQMRHRLAEL